MQFIDFKADAILHHDEYVKAYEQVLSSGWYILGKEVESFERELSQHLGAKHTIGVGNGLDALHIALLALGIGRGDEVVTTSLSAIATTLAILAVGAKPVFVDVDVNGQIDVDKIEIAITPKTKVILPVHLYGNACNLTEILILARKYGLKVIEDAAQAHGSKYMGQALGTFGDIGCFSFYPTKNLGTIGGDAGALVTDDDNIASIARQIRNYGQESKYNHIRYGINSRLDEIHATVLRAKLKWLEKSNQRKRDIAKIYTKKLTGIKGLHLVTPINGSIPNIHQFVIATSLRDELQKYLFVAGIPTLIHYPTPIHRQPFLAAQYNNISLPMTLEFCRTTLSLPSHEFMTDQEISYVCSSIHAFMQNKLK